MLDPLRDALAAALDTGERHLGADLRDVTLLSAAAIGLLSEVARRGAAEGGSLR